jgi:hypothetical protein
MGSTEDDGLAAISYFAGIGGLGLIAVAVGAGLASQS